MQGPAPRGRAAGDSGGGGIGIQFHEIDVQYTARVVRHSAGARDFAPLAGRGDL